ncbi:MAG: UvrD-helicase domain-containing protein [Rikenellaceae bacterium]
MSEILKGLNKAQYDAVINYDVASLIIAGAGSGKTRVLTSRIAYMIEQGVSPSNILALTFTKKAAEQMRERIAQMMPDGRSRFIRMGTFHSLFAKILRDNAEAIGFTRNFTIYEPNDCKSLLKSILKERGLGDDIYKPNVILSRISYAKNSLVTPAAYAANTAFATEDRRMRIPEFGNIYATYCARCKSNDSMDFDDLLLQTNILFRDHADILARYQQEFQYILVDEYQDTNYAQYIIIRRLSQLHSKVCVVGDDAQSIYSFRGAKIENIINFRKDYPAAKTFKLEQNYRSTQTIVDAANSVIERNSNRMDKRCFSAGDKGEKIKVIRAYTDREEAQVVADQIRDRVRDNADGDYSQIAVLYRTNNQSQAIEEALRRKAIPYKIYKGNSFYDHKEIRDTLAYVRLVCNPRDDEAFKRIINYPARGIGATSVDRISAIATERRCSMWEAIDALVAETPADAVQRAIIKKVTDFVAMIRTLALSRNEKSLYDFGLELASRSGILPLYRAANSPEAASAIDNIEELLNSMQLFNEQREAEIRGGEREADDTATLEEWLENVMLMTDMDNQSEDEMNRVTLMTVHSSKGLEYKYIFIVGVEENLFPSQRAVESGDIEEERRLFYVAITRAKVAATISYAEMRFKWGNMEFSRPSCFMRDIDPKYLDITDADAPEPKSRVQQRQGYGSNPAQRSNSGTTAIEELRNRFDYRHKQRREVAATTTPARPNPAIVSPPQPTSTQGMRRVGVRPQGAESSAGACSYNVGQRVEHPRFGAGTIKAIETLSTDHKLIVEFGNGEEKTLLSKFAKLTRL